ncbi:hypothetical protein NIES4102_06970 [Chondrocystis sp. NIES-4102]|nr:hypothetical protein NIES4102_06970 [Chondrocystis sp. NIES-4102]
MTQANKNNTVVTQVFIDKLIDKIGNILKEQHALQESDREQTEVIESLLEKLTSLEYNFEELTKSLALGSYPLKLARSIKVAESTITPKIVPIPISKSQLITTYNEISALLSGYIIPVTITPDSYRNSNPENLVLETTIKGNYWAIATVEEQQYKYWLVPNSNINFNIYKLKTIESLFELRGNPNSKTADFILQEPAILSLLPNNQQWQLLQPGILFFGNKLQSISPPTSQPENRIDEQQDKINKQMLSSLTTLEKTIAQLTSNITQLQAQTEISQKTYQRDRQQWLGEKYILQNEMRQITMAQSPPNNLNNEQAIVQLTSNIKELQAQVEISQKTYQRDRQQWLGEKQILQEQIQQITLTQSPPDNLNNEQAIVQLTSNIKELQAQVEISQKTYQRDRQQWLGEKQILQEQIQQITLAQSPPNNSINENSKAADQISSADAPFTQNYTTKSESNQNNQNQSNNTVDLKNIISQFRQVYSQDQQLIIDKIVAKVSISLDTLFKITFGKIDIVILEKSLDNKYWIIDYLGVYLLIPSDIKHITEAKETSLTVAKILFDLVGYYPQYTSFDLIKPAIVTKHSTNQWKLQEKGKFNFY